VTLTRGIGRPDLDERVLRYAGYGPGMAGAGTAQDAAVAHMLARVEAKGPGARRGTELALVDAVAARSSFLRRLMLRVLRA
jgi:hypothetical protein